MVSCQKGPTRHAYAWQTGPFWQDTLDVCSLSRTWQCQDISWHSVHYKVRYNLPCSFQHYRMCFDDHMMQLTHWGRDKIDSISQTTFSNAFSWIKMYHFCMISLKCVPKNRINNIPALVQIMAWRRPGNKPLSEPMMVSLLRHICITRPQWVKMVEQTLWHNES